MNSAIARTLCRVLIVLMAWTPFHWAQAGIITTEQAVASAQADRAAVLNLVQRADVASRLQALGVDLDTAQSRVAAMTDPEVRSLASNLQSVPAGGDGLVILVLVGVILWLVFWRK